MIASAVGSAMTAPVFPANRMKKDLVLFRKGLMVLRSDFLISRFPVSEKEFAELSGGAGGAEGRAALTGWQEAARYCNLLSRREGLPPAYDELSGWLLDAGGDAADYAFQAAGYRLPTKEEWDFAACGALDGRRTGAYLPLLRELFIPVDFGATPPSPMPELPREFEKMPRNPAGLAGMLGNVVEWCGEDCPGREGPKNRACGWAEYITNYNNDLGLQVEPVHVRPGRLLPFRVALTAAGGVKAELAGKPG